MCHSDNTSPIVIADSDKSRKHPYNGKQQQQYFFNSRNFGYYRKQIDVTLEKRLLRRTKLMERGLRRVNVMESESANATDEQNYAVF